jgi:hypothetical protein
VKESAQQTREGLAASNSEHRTTRPSQTTRRQTNREQLRRGNALILEPSSWCQHQHCQPTRAGFQSPKIQTSLGPSSQVKEKQIRAQITKSKARDRIAMTAATREPRPRRNGHAGAVH